MVRWYRRVEPSTMAMQHTLGAIERTAHAGDLPGVQRACRRLDAESTRLIHGPQPPRNGRNALEFFTSWRLAMFSYQTAAKACERGMFGVASKALGTGNRALGQATKLIPGNR